MRPYVYCLPLLMVLGPSQDARRGGRLDKTQAFYYPSFAASKDAVLGKTAAGSISSETYLRYLAGRLGTRYLQDLAFDLALTQECKATGLARSAPMLARRLAARRFHESGRRRAGDPDGSLQLKFANESLQGLRVDALVGARRALDKKALQGLFNRRYGVGGQRVVVRQILVSFDETRKRWPASSKSPAAAAIVAAAKQRATKVLERVSAEGFTALVAETDERSARRMARDPERKEQAGVLEGYNYLRYGEAFAAAVRSLRVAEVSQPIRTATGFHVIELVSRTVTQLAAVEDVLRQELRRAPAKPADVQALRKELLKKYGFVSQTEGR